MSTRTTGMPPQKIADSRKTKEWFKKNIAAVKNGGFFQDEGIRASYKSRKVNYDLYNGVVDVNDIMATLNPNDIKGVSKSSTIQHYPIVVPRISVLVGEELKRRFDYKVVVTNPDSVSLKEEDKLKMYKEHIQTHLEKNYKEDELKRKLEELQEYAEYEWQDYREILANKLIKHLYQENKLDLVFNDGFIDALIAGEEYYITEIVSGEPVLRRLNTDTVYWLRSGFSNRIEDADLIVIDEYWSPGRIIDTYFDKLKPAEIDQLETGFTTSGDAGKAGTNSPSFLLAETSEDKEVIDGLIEMAAQGRTLNNATDRYGNIRVLRVMWSSWRRVKRVKFYDEFGDEQIEYFPDNYKVDEDKGETASDVWIREWLEGTQIGDNIYLDLRPKPIQYHKLDNPSYCHPGITGRTYSIGTNRTVSLLDRVKKYQYLYDVTFDRLNRLIANNRGKVLSMDFSAIPEEWQPEQWFHYLTTMNIAVKDSFREGNKGRATGQLVGNLGRGGDHDYIDLDQSQGIQNYIGLLEFLKNQMSEILGVSDQRLGQIENRETIGGVERSITQSSHITEWYFYQHEHVKLEALRLLLDTAKIAYKGKSKKVQYILDDQSIQMLNIDGDDLSSHEYGLVVTTSPKSAELDKTIQDGAYALMQRGELQLSALIDLFSTNSISEKRRKIERNENKKSQEDARRFDEEMNRQKEQIAFENELRQLELKLEELKNIRDNETKLLIANMSGADINMDKLSEDKRQFDTKLKEDIRQFDAKLTVEKQKVAKANVKK